MWWLWVLEIVLFLVFVAFGGFPGFVIWFVITIGVVWANRHFALRGAEVMIQAKREERFRESHERRRDVSAFAAKSSSPKRLRARAEPAPSETKGLPCSACETPNDPDATFCKKCGAKLLPAPCAGCQTVNDADATFCKKCGKSLGSTSSKTQPKTVRAKPEAEVVRAVRCWGCETKNAAGDRQCRACGRSLGISST